MSVPVEPVFVGGGVVPEEEESGVDVCLDVGGNAVVVAEGEPACDVVTLEVAGIVNGAGVVGVNDAVTVEVWSSNCLTATGPAELSALST